MPIYDALDPTVKAFVISDAYTRFFKETLDNFEAAFKGRDVQIGREWHDAEQPLDGDSGLTLLTRLNEFIQSFRSGANALSRTRESARAQWVVDEHGFRHFAPQASLTEPPQPKGIADEVLRDLTRALRLDLGIDSSERHEI